MLNTIETIDKNKRRILYIKEFLEENTDEDHSVMMADIKKYLWEKHYIEVDRKTIINDLRALEDYLHLSIDLENGKHWKLEKRAFDLNEVSILIDSVASSRFLSEETSKRLIDKLSKLVSRYQRNRLICEIDTTIYHKSPNNFVFRTIESIHMALTSFFDDIEFQYNRYNMRKELVPTDHHVEPIRLFYDNNYCYLQALEDNELKTFRVDKMTNVLISEKLSRRSRRYRLDDKLNRLEWKPAVNYIKKEVQILFKDSAMDAVIDRFGKDVNVEIVDHDHFRIKEIVVPDLQFYTWMFSLGENAMIEYPLAVAAEMMDLLKERYKAYREGHSRNIYYYRRKNKTATTDNEE